MRHDGVAGWISLQSKGLSRVFSNTTVQKHQFFGAQLSSQSNSHIQAGRGGGHGLVPSCSPCPVYTESSPLPH